MFMHWKDILRFHCWTCGFHCWNKETGEVEIGYDLYPTYWKQSYTTEALEKIIDFAEDIMKVNKIYAHISVDNIPSIKTAMKQGFVKTEESYYEEFHGKKYLHDVYERLL